MLDEQCSLSQISEKIGELSGNSPPISGLSDYIKKYPKEAEVSKPVETKITEPVAIVTTEKEIEPLSVMKQAADKVFSSVDESRVESKTNFVTPNEQEKLPENEQEKSTNPFKKVVGSIGKTKPDFDEKAKSKYI